MAAVHQPQAFQPVRETPILRHFHILKWSIQGCRWCFLAMWLLKTGTWVYLFTVYIFQTERILLRNCPLQGSSFHWVCGLTISLVTILFCVHITVIMQIAGTAGQIRLIWKLFTRFLPSCQFRLFTGTIIRQRQNILRHTGCIAQRMLITPVIMSTPIFKAVFLGQGSGWRRLKEYLAGKTCMTWK